MPILSSFESLTGVPEAVAYIFVFLFGAAVGSFLNVVIHRVPNEESIVFPNSACPKCKTPIKAYDNIPLFGWLMLGGKCRSCKEPISARYPAVELLNALLWVLVYWRVGISPMLPVDLIFVSAMVALIFIDAEHMILPNVITYPLLVIALLIRIIFPIVFAQNYFSDTLYSPATYLAGKPAWLISLVRRCCRSSGRRRIAVARRCGLEEIARRGCDGPRRCEDDARCRSFDRMAARISVDLSRSVLMEPSSE
jgi:prepilin signal peptidase PulO-like enzyme (type II secretory pathway)